MPFGFKKGDKEGGDLDAQKSSLFGKSSSKASRSPAPRNNPYAVPPPTDDPYASKGANPYATQSTVNDPYARSQSSFTQPPTSSFGSLTLNSQSGYPQENRRGPSPQPNRYEKSPVPQGGYGAPPSYQSGGYGGGSGYEQQGGYGNDPYSNGRQQQQSYSRPGGYGGMGRSNSQDTMTTDAGRNALFGDAPTRAAQQQTAPEEGGDSSYSNTGGYGSSDLPGGYGASVPDRELTAEEQEEQDVSAAKQEIKFIKGQDVSSTRNALRIAQETERTGRETLERLGAQGDRIHNTERNLDMASNQNRLAEEKARELRTLNRSMFAVHVANPFTKSAREQAADQIAMDKNRAEREQREATSAQAYNAKARQQGYQRDVNGNVVRPAGAQRSLAERSKYQFEADSEDEEMENEIDGNLDALHSSVRTIRALGDAMGSEIEAQNKTIIGVSKKADKVDDQIAANRARLDRFGK